MTGCAEPAGNDRQGRRDGYRERRHNVELHALVAQIDVLYVAEFHRYVFGHLNVARFDVEADAKWRRRERNSELDIRVQDLNGLILRMLPVVIVKVGSGQPGSFRNAYVGGAGVDCILLHVTNRAAASVSKPAIETAVTLTSDAPWLAARMESFTG